jgi:hypothetical protein
VNRHHDSTGSTLVVEHDVASTPSHLAPTGLAESPQSFVAGDSRESRHSWKLGRILSVNVIVRIILYDPDSGFWRSSVRGPGPLLPSSGARHMKPVTVPREPNLDLDIRAPLPRATSSRRALRAQVRARCAQPEVRSPIPRPWLALAMSLGPLCRLKTSDRA